MTASQLGPASAETLHDERTTQQPMPQQDLFSDHGHDMHLQKFVRLVGCHDSRLAGPRRRDEEQTH